jgi:polar amino acid transport system permease protein
MEYLATSIALLTRLLPSLWAGFQITLGVAATAMPLAFLAGLMLLPARTSRRRTLSAAALAYIEVMRNTPLLLQIYLIYFGLPLLGLFPSEFACGAVGIALQHGAFLAEIFRAGIESISQRQWEAAHAIGMGTRKTFVHVIAPQACLRILGPLGNQLIVLIKDTSLVSAIGVSELTMSGKLAIERTAAPIEIFAAIALFYFTLTTVLGAGLRVLEHHTQGRY